MTCKNCFHEEACATWIHHGETLYDDFEYSIDNCPYYYEVVWCKDCKWFDPNENIMPQSGTCGYHEMVKMFWDFCSRGKVGKRCGYNE